MSVHSFDDRYRRLLQHALASFLDTSPEDITIISVEEGSVKVTLGIPFGSVGKLLSAFGRRDPEFLAYLEHFPVLNVYETIPDELADIIAEILGVSSDAIKDNPGQDLFELDMHSLSVVRILAAIKKKFGVDLPFACIFENPTPLGISQLVAASERDGELKKLLAELELLSEVSSLAEEDLRQLLGVEVDEED